MPKVTKQAYGWASSRIKQANQLTSPPDAMTTDSSSRAQCEHTQCVLPNAYRHIHTLEQCAHTPLSSLCIPGHSASSFSARAANWGLMKRSDEENNEAGGQRYRSQNNGTPKGSTDEIFQKPDRSLFFRCWHRGIWRGLIEGHFPAEWVRAAALFAAVFHLFLRLRPLCLPHFGPQGAFRPLLADGRTRKTPGTDN